METIVPLCPSCKWQGIYIHGKDTILGKCFTCLKRKNGAIYNIEKFLSPRENEIMRLIKGALGEQLYDIICSISIHGITFKKRPGSRGAIPSQFRWVKEGFGIEKIQAILGDINEMTIVFPLADVYKLIIAGYNGEFIINTYKPVKTASKKYKQTIDKQISQIIMSFIKSECALLWSINRQLSMDGDDFDKIDVLERRGVNSMLVSYIRENATIDFNIISPLLDYAMELGYHKKTSGVPVIKKNIVNVPDGFVISH